MTTSDTELEPQHVFENRIRARILETERAATDAASAEEAASAEVTQLRGDFKIGLVPRGEWDKAAKRLAKLQNARADADAALLATQRDIARQRDARQAAEIVAKRTERQAFISERAASIVLAQELFGSIWGAVEAINLLPSIPSLSAYRGDWERLQGALLRLQSRY